MRIGVFGTFDVENYGDLLFPILAEAELARRLGAVELLPFSYHARTRPHWPYDVTSLTDLPRIAHILDGALIGGGFIVRFDKDVASDYRPPTTDIHHPTGYWLTPALIALQNGVPLFWNAPGMHCNEIPEWAGPLMRLTLTHSRYIAVRDKPSQEALEPYANKSQITVVPDTAFGISRLLDRRPSAELTRLCETSRLSERYIIVQATRGLNGFIRFLKTNGRHLQDYQVLSLPIGPVLGDGEELLDDDLPGLVRLPDWPQPLVIAELISRASAVVGHSYHLAITALACGVPVFSPVDVSVGKFTALAGFDTIFSVPDERDKDFKRFVSRLGKTEPCPAARAAVDRVADHWDRIAAILMEGPVQTQPAVSQFWQTLPSVLEAPRDDVESFEIKEQRKQIDQLKMSLAVVTEELAAREKRIEAIYHSPSMRITAPLRYLMRGLKHLLRRMRPE